MLFQFQSSILFVLLCLSFAGKTVALPDGSPVCSVDSGVPHRKGNLGFSLKASSTQITAGKPITFTISGGTMAGLLIYVEGQSGKHVGTFSNLGSGYKAVDASACKSYTSKDSTVTHSKRLSSNAPLTWTLGASDSQGYSGPFTVKAMVVAGSGGMPGQQILAPVSLTMGSGSAPANNTAPITHGNASPANPGYGSSPSNGGSGSKKCRSKGSYAKKNKKH